LLKSCKRWKQQQTILWEEVRRDTGRGKIRFKIRNLLAEERCTRSILDFLRTTEVGCRVGPRVVPLEPGEGRSEERRSEGGDTGRLEGEELRDDEGAEEE